MKALRRTLLRDGALTVGIAPECGGALTRFDVRVGDTLVDVFRPAVDGPGHTICALGSSCFPLVPYGGRLREGRFRFGGRSYQYALNAPPERHSSHGDGWTRAWVLTHLDRRCAIMKLPADEALPLRYQCTQSIAVEQDRVRIVLSARNEGSQAIPMGLGLHPYFANRGQATIAASLPIHWRWDQELMPLEEEANALAAVLEKGRSVMGLPVTAEYAGWDGRAAIEWPEHRVRVDLLTTPRLEHVVMWLPKGETFFCFEPISHATDALNAYPAHAAGECFAVLEPTQVVEQCFDFTVSVH
jgi:aldose 1-epimerase